MTEVAAKALDLTNAATNVLRRYTPKQWRASRGEGKWTRVEVIGHLIDSAVNNHQRFVRALIQDSLEWPGYSQNEHVAVQRYATEDPFAVLDLWISINRHIAHVLAQVPESKAETPCSIGGAKPLPLWLLARDYVVHMEHHLRQALEGVDHKLEFSGLPWPPEDTAEIWYGPLKPAVPA